MPERARRSIWQKTRGLIMLGWPGGAPTSVTSPIHVQCSGKRLKKAVRHREAIMWRSHFDTFKDTFTTNHNSLRHIPDHYCSRAGSKHELVQIHKTQTRFQRERELYSTANQQRSTGSKHQTWWWPPKASSGRWRCIQLSAEHDGTESSHTK